MKRNISAFLILAFVISLASGFAAPAKALAAADGFRAVWVSSVLNLDFPSRRVLTLDELKAEIDANVNRAAELGLNAIILQVRPSGDALYKSEIFPWSEFLTGIQGAVPEAGFDPLAYWIERAHARGLELHAWLNPFRITHTAVKTTDVNRLAANNPARLNPSLAVEYNGALYYDPGLPESRRLIIDGAAELVSNYGVDGIHLDDYFYPGADFGDAATYQRYGGGLSLEDWRRENINAVVRGIHERITELDPEARFGVSPPGIWQNSSSNPEGSDTRGYEAYTSSYADTRRWVKEGWLDYICPQIYWNIGFEAADYAKLTAWWEEVCRGTGVDLYIGHAAYKENTEAGWQGEILRQLRLNAASDVIKGSVFFRISFLTGELAEQIKNFYAGSGGGQQAVPAVQQPPASLPAAQTATPAPTAYEPSVIMDKLTVAQPSRDVTVTAAQGYNVHGTCLPGGELYLNGRPVANRTPEGFFSVYFELSGGENVLTFTQDGQEAVTRVITNKSAVSSGPATLRSPAILNPYPASDEYVSSGDTVAFSCTAPAGAQIFVDFYGETYELKSSGSGAPSAQLYAERYSFDYALFEPGGETSVTDLGKPVYRMTYENRNYTATAEGSIQLIGRLLPYYATVTADAAWLYGQAGYANGSSWSLVKGQKDRITAVTDGGGWYRLASGKWIEEQNISPAVEDVLVDDVLSDAVYEPGVNADVIRWRAAAHPATDAVYDGKKLTVYFGMHTDVPSLAEGWQGYTESELVESTLSGWNNSMPYLELTLKEGARLEGYYTEYAGGEMRLVLKKRRALSAGDRPLTGFTIVVDAGHGQSEPGSHGPMGNAMPEKNINLANALKLASRLERQGANAVLVRNSDTGHSLQSRTDLSRGSAPDMFVSIHANSLAETTDATKVNGLTVWYMHGNSAPLADTLMTRLFNVNPLTTRQPRPNRSNLFVCRPVWTPSVIIESSFMCNIQDFAWIINGDRQNELADGIVAGILDYYR